MKSMHCLNQPSALFLTLLGVLAATFAAAAGGADKPMSAEPGDDTAASLRAWAKVPEILSRIVPPVFPARDFVVTKYGAVADGVTDSTKAVQGAIEDCHRAGGGRVLVPPGAYVTGAIRLLGGVNLCIEKGATILFSTNTQDYLPTAFTRYEGTEVFSYSPFVYALEQNNIAITGDGTLDGRASLGIWYQWRKTPDADALVAMAARGVPVAERRFGAGGHLRPNFIEPVRCRNVLIEGVHITNSPMWVLHPLYCTNVTIRGVTVSTRGPNTDGCDPDSCSDVLIRSCSFGDGDDCIAVKSGRDGDGRKVKVPCENVVIQDCVFREGHGGVAIGSETSGGISDVFAENCRFDSPDLDYAMRFKTNPARGGYIRDIYIRNCSVQTARFGIHMTMRYASSGARDGGSMPELRRIDIRDSSFAKLTKQTVFIEGYSSAAPISDVTIANCQFLQSAGGAFVTNAVRVRFPGTRGSGLN